MSATKEKPVLVTGVAGFIGFHVAHRLLRQGVHVVGIDNLNPYYDLRLKEDRLKQLLGIGGFNFHKVDVAENVETEKLFRSYGFLRVIHLAAQAGVRYSLINPWAYGDSNLTGFLNVLEGCRRVGSEHLVFASSSSVYGANRTMPFSVLQNVDHPVSLYAATKKANELMAHAYAHLYGLPCTGLRFFTVYGPWGRPDMALFLFTKAILDGQPIKVFNYGKMKRDFTYIDDIVDGVVRILGRPPRENSSWTEEENPPGKDHVQDGVYVEGAVKILDRPPRENGDRDEQRQNPGKSDAPYRIYNIGNSHPFELLEFISVLEKSLGVKAQKIMLPMQPGDVPSTYADIEDLKQEFDYQPRISIYEGIPRFVKWYRSYYDKRPEALDTGSDVSGAVKQHQPIRSERVGPQSDSLPTGA